MRKPKTKHHFHFRWMATANGYIRHVLFKSDELSPTQKGNSLEVIKWVMNVYFPNFLRVHFKPRVPDGPKNMLYLRDLVLAYQYVDEEMTSMIKPHFLRHAVTWGLEDRILMLMSIQKMHLSTFWIYSMIRRVFRKVCPWKIIFGSLSQF